MIELTKENTNLLLGAIIKQALDDLFPIDPINKKKLKYQYEAKQFFKNSPIFKCSGLDKDELIEMYLNSDAYKMRVAERKNFNYFKSSH